jgi:uncharacterized protein with GYD domain
LRRKRIAGIDPSSLAIAVEARSIATALPVKSFCRPCEVRFHCGFRLADDSQTVSLPARSNRRLTAATVGGRWHRPSLSNRGDDMITYVGLMSFTDKGLLSIKDTTKRAAAAKEAAKKVGVNMRELVWTQGEYDLVSIVEGEDEKSLAAFTLAIALQGNIRFQSLRAFSSSEMDEILAKLP